MIKLAGTGRFAKVDEATKKKFFSPGWGSTLLTQVGLDPSEADLANTMLVQTWNAAFDALDSGLEKAGVDTTKAGKAGFDWNYAAAGIAYFVAEAVLRSLFTRQQVAPDSKLTKTMQQLVKASAKFTKKPDALPSVVQAVLPAVQTAAAKKAQALAQQIASQPDTALPKAASAHRTHR